MVLVLILATFFSIAWGQQSSPVLDPDKFTVCAITINSDDEKKIFQAQAAKFPQKFNPVVELTDLGGDDWFAKSCSSGIRCDQLVISGHFAGSFFGESEKNLSLNELETAGCSKSCEGILNQPYEVFLFGCNTLSGKDGDSRTPAQYLQVLLSDGIPLAQAELVVESRYGAIGDSHKASMQRAFSGETKQLYGFDSVGPSGKNVKGFINNYFTKIKADSQLEKLQAKRMMNTLDMTNKYLAESLKSTAFTQCSAANDNDEKMKKVCGLLDSRLSTDKKLDLTIELLSQEDYFAYLPGINHFMKDLNYDSLTKSEKNSFDLIKNNTVLKGQIFGLIDKTDSLGLKSEWIMLARNMGYLTDEEASERLGVVVSKVFAKPLKESDVEMLCSLNMDVAIKIQNKDIPKRTFNQNDLFAFGCLTQGLDAPLTNRLVNSAVIGPEVSSVKMGLAMNGNNAELSLPSSLIQYAKKQLSSEDNYLVEDSLRFMATYSKDDQAFKMAFQKQLNLASSDKDKLYTIVDVAEVIEINDAPTLLKMKSLLRNDDYFDGRIIRILTKSKSENSNIQNEIASIMSDKEIKSYNKVEVFKYIERMKNPDPVVYKHVVEYLKGFEPYQKREAIDFLEKAPLTSELRAEFEKLK